MSGVTAARSIPRNSLIWLLVAQVLVILPHLSHLPLWVVGLWLGCGLWRIQIFRMRAPYPSAVTKLALMVGAGAGVYASRGSLVGLDAGVVLLIAAFVLKLVEMRTRRDALVLILLGFFAVVTSYLFEESIVAALFSLLPIVALLAAMIGLQQNRLHTAPWPTVRLAGGLLLQALPLMLVLFVFFPRFGPLWSMPNPSDKGVTGLSESMAPGDIAELSRSGALAFRASFEGPLPPREQLYWRAVTFERFDGRRWSQAFSSYLPQAPQWQPRGEALGYSVVMQPSGRPWLFALDVPQLEAGDARMMGDFHLQRAMPVDKPLLYEVRSWPQALREPQALPDNLLAQALQLPESGNPRSRAWGEALRRSAQNPEQVVATLLSHFNREPFGYTLQPPPVGTDIVDDFLFQTRQGFCIHYAGSMVFLLRAAGIPSRIVAGYQGGEYNPAGNYLAVRQYDAHAWVEYWVQGRGWITVDPTFQVAPERIEFGLEQALGEEHVLDESPMSLMRFRDIGWLNELRLGWDNLNYGWQRWVLGYQGEQQMDVLRRWFGSFDLQTLGLGLVGACTALVGLLAVFLLKPWRRERDPLRRQFLRFERMLAGQGLVRQPGEGPRAFAERAARALPGQAGQIRSIGTLYEACRYAGDEQAAQQLPGALGNLRRALPWRRAR
ncbi:DUF3488 domain-containing protein [Stutzerimonas nosocomialis]|uniref:DUF3488 domain-containing protein n=1 Tax=Stutzerimonas nosocomialis TaxID=1056496 RepID=A0A5R9QAW6_9GAMM|nr:DUF3488 and transglutaminase-like domain-containing protein [Stutzerimonas nosocomialis]TLX60130.1 DUF3488 domain-containing protein [Stutzerimonas nosocomialis]TLX62130.1 DUF3488 domain-containing protein [Stutzerimonas nosocomialis]